MLTVEKVVDLKDVEKLIDKLNKQSTNANEEHKRLRNGKDKDFNKYEEELNKKK